MLPDRVQTQRFDPGTRGKILHRHRSTPGIDPSDHAGMGGEGY